MAWDYRSPSKFDARISSIMGKTLSTTDREVAFYFKTEASARAFMLSFRHFRWCVRQDREQAGSYYELELNYDFRAKYRYNHSGHSVTIRAVPARLAAMFTLNPWLTGLDPASHTN